MRILVLGGTAFFGSAIVRRLLERGDEVTVFSRGAVRPDWWDRADHIIGDRFDPASLEQLRGRTFDAAVDNIAYTDRDVSILLDVLSAGRYVLTSSSAVYATVAGYAPYREEDVDLSFRPPKEEADSPRWTYTVGKLTAEQAVIDRCVLPWTIIRPPIVLGPHDPTLRGWYYFQRILDGGPLLVPCCGERSFRIVYSEDLAAGYLLAIDAPGAAGRTYNLAQQEIVRLSDVLTAAAAGLDTDVELVEMSRDELRRAGVVGPYDRMSNFIPDVTRAVTELGYRSSPFDEWVGQTARWYRDHYEGPDAPGYEHRAVELRLAAVR